MALSRKSKIFLFSGIGLLLLIIIVATIFATRKDIPSVNTVKIEKRTELRSVVTASGEVRPIQFMNLTSEVQGRIEEIYVKEGDQVKKGQLLVKLDPNQLESSADAQFAAYQSSQQELAATQTQVTAAQNQLMQSEQALNASDAAVNASRQNVVASQTDVDRAQVDVNTAQREFNRNAQLLESGVISRFEYDQKKDQLELAQASLRNARARLESAKISVNEAIARRNQQAVAVRDAKRAVETANINVRSSRARADQQAAALRGQRNQRDKTLQVAPINGIIAEIPSKVGTFAVAGLSTTALMTIADMSTVNIEVKVDETSIDRVAVGQKAKVKVDALGDREVVGEVTQKTPLAVGKSQTSGGLSTNINVQEAKEFRVVIELKDISEEVKSSLRPGMSATAEITTATANDVVAVPLQALIEKKPEASPSPTLAGDGAQPAEKAKPILGVYILVDGKAKFREVQPGIIGESDRQVLSGVEAGDEVITGPGRVLSTLKDDSPVKRAEKKDTENANK